MANVRYVTRWDGRAETVRNIQNMLKVFGFDNDYKVSSLADGNLMIKKGNERGIICPLDWDVIIPKEGQMSIKRG